ncbi:beta-galactosidase GalA [Flavobacterium agrisoli]|uniref:DUF4982 domain-containing protein n=1 Tax=Flavobacterium agrisoli TaxID=2793066 RepID=A0A934PK62_9FLAO|nr:beta-galactosidase GalA [Flavobacterium agrisoli]MBK0369097.1 DUF4982 domain-containing protein [Flavobacterium agrisoli]
MNFFSILSFLIISFFYTIPAQCQNHRERINIDKNWRFAFGHPFDAQKDFNTGTAYFSYLAKAGFGDGAAAKDFDDRAWRKLDLPHDWAVEQEFSPKASFSHGFKAIGRNFPEKSVGWYRKKIDIPSGDYGKRIHIVFDGIFRNSIIWVNGHYLGQHDSGYLGVEYDISEYLNYGGENTIAVRVDATMEEGWFYEGAGIYRHVWLTKTHNLHVASNGTFVKSMLNDSFSEATIDVMASVSNDTNATAQFQLVHAIFDSKGNQIASKNIEKATLKPRESNDFTTEIQVQNPNLWSTDSPYLYRMKTSILKDKQLVDMYETRFGIRSIKFDSDNGFFLNGKSLKIKGTNNHQDHAGLGIALPDAVQKYRLEVLQSFGSNAYRCSHNPPSPELLGYCDEMGILVIDENRLMGITETHLGDVKKLIARDRNHPSIISWSIGNEEWAIENSNIGARIASNMQAFVKSLDETRPATIAFSGGIGSEGVTTTIDLLGVNYVAKRSTDKQHALFPNQSIWGTEEGSTNATRGAYYRDDEKHIIPAYDKSPNDNFLSIEDGWKYYNSRKYLAGMFVWTGFDYRGEPTPYGWPSVGTYFGMVDQCGFYKDSAWYLKAWWQNEPVLHLLPHWNWAGKENQNIEVWVYSNCDEVELFLNKKSLGKQKIEKEGHLQWNVPYQPGTLEAIGYKKGKKIKTETIKTAGQSAALVLKSNKKTLQYNENDVAMITVSSTDKNGIYVPTANHDVTFSISGPAKIIGVGNGNPTSLEPDKFLETITVLPLDSLKEKYGNTSSVSNEIKKELDDSSWQKAFLEDRNADFGGKVKNIVYRSTFELPAHFESNAITLFYKSVGKTQSIYINGKLIADAIPENPKGDTFRLDKKILKAGKNSIAVVATPLLKVNTWDVLNQSLGCIQLLHPAQQYKRKLFNGLAQVIVQTTGGKGEIKLTAVSNGLKSAEFILQSNKKI